MRAAFAMAGMTDAQAAKLRAAREREAKLAREEAELVAGGKLPPSRWDARGEVYTLSADAFTPGKADFTQRGQASMRTLASYLQITSAVAVRIEGVDASAPLSQQRVECRARGPDPSRVRPVSRSGRPSARRASRSRGSR